MIAFGQPTPSWNLASDVRQLLEYPFMVHALEAGTIVAVLAAAVGWFTVLRRQTFAAHTLALVGFPGAAGAVLVGLGATDGYLAFCVVAALVFATVAPGDEREGSAVIGTTQAFILACGYLFVTLYSGNLNGVQSLLFGSFLGITADQVAGLAVFATAAVVVLLAMARPLLFASVDPGVAASRGVPVRVLSTAFLVVLGVAAAETSQITGTLLVFALLVLPAATAQRLTARPAASAVLAVLVGVAVTWVGLGIAYFSPYPSGFWVTTIAFLAYLGAHLRPVDRHPRHPHGPSGDQSIVARSTAGPVGQDAP